MSKEIIRPEQFAQADKALLMREEDLQLSEQMVAEVNALYQGVFDALRVGRLVSGTVVSVGNDGVLVDIGYKSDGLIPPYEFTESELRRFKTGDKIEVILDQLESLEGSVVLSYEKAKALKAWDAIIKMFEENKPVEGLVTHKVKGGLSVDIGIPAFLPGSQIDLQRVVDFDQYVGQTITANVIKLNKKRGNVIISRRKFLSDQRSEARKKILETLSESQVIQGVVKNITNYGAFIDIGGVDGLLHITDMTWGRISHPSELVRIGETITVKVLSFDKTNEKISLGLKQLSENPWEKVAESLKPGEKIKGIISSITDYGLFIEIAKGVEGLVHISEVSWTDRINDLSKKFKVGEEIEVLVVSVDKENRRMSLSIKQLEKNPWESVEEQYHVGDKITGTISNITDFGIFVQIMPGIDGLVHISDLSWVEHINHPGDLFKRGDSVEAVILSIDKANKKISLGIKQLGQDPWAAIEEEYPAGKIVEGEVSKITNFGAFIRFPSGIEGLVHISELSDGNVEKVEDVLKVGQVAQFRVINVSRTERKLGLSMKLTPSAPVAKEVSKETRAAEEKRSSNVAKKAPQKPLVERPKSLFQLELEKAAAYHKGQADKDDKAGE